MRNLKVNFGLSAPFNKIMVHKSVSFIQKEMHFRLNSLIINFVSTEDIIKINSEYLKHYYSTDIITFDYSETNSDIDGEIYISLEDAHKNAEFYNIALEEEIIRLITHGILHLLGYNDQKPEDKKIMKNAEDKLVNKQKFIWA